MIQRKNSLIFLGKIILFSLVLISAIFFFTTLFQWISKSDRKANPTTALALDDPRPVVILDAGHGGTDSGAVSVLGHEEKHLNLAVAKKLGAFLEAGGLRVIYSRQEDIMLSSSKTKSHKMGDLIARVDLAKEYPEAYFVSIHMNTLPIEKYWGLQVFYSQNHSLNRPLAQVIQNDVRSLLQPENKREISDAKGNIYILDRISGPAVLIECGFLSNYKEAEKLAQEDYQNQLAFVLSRSILSFALEKEN